MDYAVIMAGGSGKRLWPLSRESRPKQVLKLLNGETLLRRCYDRLLPIFDQRNIIVLTNAGYSDIVRENLPELPYGNVIAEPAVRDTSGAIGLAASVLTKYDRDASMTVVTSDHLIEPEEGFQQAVRDGLNFVNNNPESKITFGIQPTYASTQLGYVKVGGGNLCDRCKNEIFEVESFKEKPDSRTAKGYVESGDYYWNSGMFIWKAGRILDELTKYQPECSEPLKIIQNNWDGPRQEQILKDNFVKLPKISIDYAVMEKTSDVYMIKLDCRWLDMGSFAALADVISSDSNGNIVVAGHSELLDSKNNVIVTEDEGHLIAVIGLENMVVAHSPDATLVCHMDATQRLKELLELIHDHTDGKFL